MAHWRLGNLEAAVQRVATACAMPGAPPEALAAQKDLVAFQDRKTKVSSSPVYFVLRNAPNASVRILLT